MNRRKICSNLLSSLRLADDGNRKMARSEASSFRWALKTATLGAILLLSAFSAEAQNTVSWTDQDIGAVGAAGSSQTNAQTGAITVQGAGADIWGAADAFHFTYHAVSGDCTLIARVANVSNTNPYTKAGIMLRDGSGVGAINSLLLVTPSNGVNYQRRYMDDGDTSQTNYVNGNAPVWLKIQRAGQQVTASMSPDGVTWTIVTTDQVAMDANLYVGLALTSYVPGTLATATFDNISISSSGPSSLPHPWACSDLGAPGFQGYSLYNSASGAFSVAASGADIWNTADEGQYLYQQLIGDGQIVAHVTSQQFTDYWAKTGVMFRTSLDATSPHAFLCLNAGGGIGFEQRNTSGAETSYLSDGGASPGVWLKLERHGNLIVGSQSPDDTNWTIVGTAQISLGSKIYAGLATASHNDNSLSEAVFDNVSVQTLAPTILPSPWLDADIGAPSLTGGAQCTNNVFAVEGSGSDIWNAADQFNFVYQPLTGDGEVIAYVNSLTDLNVGTKACVMIRESLNPGSTQLSTQCQSGYGVTFQGRTSTAGLTTIWGNFPSNIETPLWIKIQRQGNLFTSSYSSDGTNWQIIQTQTVTMANQVYAGLAVSSRDVSQVAGASFSNVTFVQAPSVPTGVSATISGSQAQVNWLPSSSGNVQNYIVQESSDLGNTWTTVSEVSGTTTSQSVSGVATNAFFRVEAQNAIGTVSSTALNNNPTPGTLAATSIIGIQFTDSHVDNESFTISGNTILLTGTGGTYSNASITYSSSSTPVSWLNPLTAPALIDNEPPSLDRTNFRVSNSEPSSVREDVINNSVIQLSGQPNEAVTISFNLAWDYMTSAVDYYTQNSTVEPLLTKVGGDNQATIAGGQIAPAPLILQVTDQSTGDLVMNAPITFTVTQGGGQLSPLATGGPVGTTINLTTDANGLARVYYQQPVGTAVTSIISAAAGSVSANYTESTLPNLSVSSGSGQSVASNTFALSPLKVQFFTSAGVPWSNAPLTFALTSGASGGLSTTNGGSLSSSVTINTDVNGFASAYYAAGSDALKTNSVVVSETSTGDNETTTFTENCGAPENLLTWTDYDVGAVGATGGSTQNQAGQSFSVTGAGTGTGTTADSLHLLCQPASEDVEMVARVSSLENSSDPSGTSAYAAAGLMIRDGSSNPATDVSSANAYVAVTAGNGLIFTTRDSAGNVSNSLGATQAAPVWLRLVRSPTTVFASGGTTPLPGYYVLAGYYSMDGTNWTLVGSETMQMANSALLGMAVSSNTTGVTATGTFDNVHTILNAPQRSPNLIGWYRADFGVVSTDGAVSSWLDQSGNGNNAVQTNANNQPVFVASGLAGEPVLQFNGSNSWLSIPNSSQLNPSNLTIIAVTRNNGSGAGMVFDKSPSASGGFGLDFLGANAPTFSINGVSEPGNLNSGSYGVIESVYDQTKLSVYVNGVLSTFNYNGQLESNSLPITIGGSSLSGSNLNGDIAEVLVYNTALTTSLRQQVEAYLFNKYGIGVPPVNANSPTLTSQGAAITGGTYTGTQTFQIQPGDSGQTIYYTTDGSTPTLNSLVYSGSITVSSTKTITAVAYENGYAASAPVSATFTINTPPPPAVAPSFSVISGQYESTQSVAINPGITGETIYYTTDGSVPSSNSTLYNGAITVSQAETVHAIAYQTGYSPSTIVSATYSFGLTPTFNSIGLVGWYRADAGVPSSGAVATWRDESGLGNDALQSSTSEQPSVSSTTINNQATLQFNGSAYLSVPNNIHSGQLTVIAVVEPTSNSSGIVVDNSPSASAGYSLRINGGTSSTLYVNGATDSDTITNGSPSVVEGVYDQNNLSLFVNGNETPMRAPYGTAVGANAQPMTIGGAVSGMGLSGNIAEILIFNRALDTQDRNQVEAYLYQRYAIGVEPPPTLSVVPGIYSSAQTILIGAPIADQTVRYTLDGTTPTSSSPVFSTSNPISIASSSETVNAAVFVGSQMVSSVASGTYTIDPTTTFTRGGLVGWYRADTGIVASGGNVSAWQDQSGQSGLSHNAVQNTTGNQPTVVANGINGHPTLQFRSSTGTFLAAGNDLNPGNLTVIAVVQPTSSSSGDVLDKSPGSSGGYALRINSGNSPTLYINGTTDASTLTGGAFAVVEGLYDGSNLSLFTNGNPVPVQTNSLSTIGTNIQPLTIGGSASGTSGLDGNIAEILIFNQALSTSDRQQVEAYLYQRYGIGAQPVASSPVLGLPQGTYLSSQNVSLASISEVNQTIYYTTDGSIPTQSSSVYSGAIAVNTTETITAVAYQSGFAISSPITATYTIDPTTNFTRNGLVGWYRADTGVVSNGSSVNTWQDQSGQTGPSHDANQTSTGNQPTFVANSFNGHPSIQFSNSSGTFLTAGNDLNPVQLTVIAVVQPTSSNSGVIVDKSPSAAGGYGLRINGGTSPTLYINGATDTTSITNGTAAVIEGLYDGTHLSLYTNGNSAPTQTAYSTAIGVNTQPLTIGGAANGTLGLDGKIAEILIFSGSLDPSDREQVEAYLYQRYGIGAQPVALTPTLSIAQGIYSGPQALVISSGDANAKITYTLDGSAPTINSTTFSAANPIPITAVQTVRTAAFESGELPSPIVTASYAIDSATTFTRQGLVAWYRSDTGVLTSTGTTSVSTWQDQSGNRNDAAASPGNRPSAVPNVLNGQPVLRFTISNPTFLTVPDSAAFDNPAGVSIITVQKCTSTNPISSIVDKYPQYCLNMSSGTTPGFYVNGNTPSITGSTIPSGTFALTEGLYNQNNLSFYTNGALNQSGRYVNPLSSSSNPLVVGGRGTNGQDGWDGDIAEVLVFSGSLSDQDRQSVEYYLANRYHIITQILSSPSFSVSASGLTTPGQVAIEAPTGSIIYYTTDGTIPTTSSQIYTGPISVGYSETINAIAYENGFVTSSLASVSYTLNPTLYPAPQNNPSDHTAPTITLQLPSNASLIP